MSGSSTEIGRSRRAHDHVHPVLEEGRGVAEQIARQADLLVVFLVHEGQHVAVGEQELEVLGVEPDALDRLGGAEADVVLAAVDEVLRLDLIRRRPCRAGCAGSSPRARCRLHIR